MGTNYAGEPLVTLDLRGLRTAVSQSGLPVWYIGEKAGITEATFRRMRNGSIRRSRRSAVLRLCAVLECLEGDLILGGNVDENRAKGRSAGNAGVSSESRCQWCYAGDAGEKRNAVGSVEKPT